MKRGKFIVVIGLLFVCLNARAQTCKDNITLTTPDSRFTVTGDGTVKDKQTGLIWMRCVLGQTLDGTICIGNAATYTWQQALQAADQYSFIGNSDWRVPNVKELASIVEEACYEPAINQVVFPATPFGWSWTSSPDVNNNDYAWLVSFGNGYSNGSGNNSRNFYVRLVRSDSD